MTIHQPRSPHPRASCSLTWSLSSWRHSTLQSVVRQNPPETFGSTTWASSSISSIVARIKPDSSLLPHCARLCHSCCCTYLPPHLHPRAAIMDEKRHLPLHHTRTAEMTAPTRRRRTRLWLSIVALALVTYSLLSTYNVNLRIYNEAKASAAKAISTASPKKKVPLEAHIISKCPDTRVRLLRATAWLHSPVNMFCTANMSKFRMPSDCFSSLLCSKSTTKSTLSSPISDRTRTISLGIPLHHTPNVNLVSMAKV